jgi:hypothetical protein
VALVIEPSGGQREIVLFELDAHTLALRTHRRDCGGAAAQKGVENKVAFAG